MAGTAKKPNTVAVATSIIEPVLQELGLTLWDCRYEKEGATWYLRYFVDKPGGVNIQDLESVSRAVDKLLDEADPIAGSYTLEVCSPGIERQLVKDDHFRRYMDSLVSVRLIRPVEGVRDFVGRLTAKEGEMIHIVLDEAQDGEDGVEMVFSQKEAAYIRLYADIGTGGLE